jgi:hypothetical protein
MATLSTKNENKMLEKVRSRYLLGSAIVWGGHAPRPAVVLSGTSYLIQALPILIGGIVWFVVIVPAALLSPQGHSPDEPKSQERTS